MKKFLIGFFAVFFQLLGLMFYMAAAHSYEFAMMSVFINNLIAFLLYFWLFSLLQKPKYVSLKFGMASSVVLGLVGLVSYLDVSEFFG